MHDPINSMSCQPHFQRIPKTIACLSTYLRTYILLLPHPILPIPSQSHPTPTPVTHHFPHPTFARPTLVMISQPNQTNQTNPNPANLSERNAGARWDRGGVGGMGGGGGGMGWVRESRLGTYERTEDCCDSIVFEDFDSIRFGSQLGFESSSEFARSFVRSFVCSIACSHDPSRENSVAFLSLDVGMIC